MEAPTISIKNVLLHHHENGEMVPMEVLGGEHRPDAETGSSETVRTIEYECECGHKVTVATSTVGVRVL